MEHQALMPKGRAAQAGPSGQQQAKAWLCGIAKCCCCCGNIVLFTFVATLLWLVCVSNVTVHGTTFTYWNYYIHQRNYLLAGIKDNTSLIDFQYSFARENPQIGEGPGPNTRIFYGWNDVMVRLSNYATRITKGTLERYSELGITIQNEVMWPEVGTIALGYSNADHALVRPYLGNVLDKARKEGRTCTGSDCWNKAWLRQVFKARFAATGNVSSNDLKWIITVVFHKLHLNIDLTDAEAQAFGNWMTKQVIPQALPPDMARAWLPQWLLGVSGLLDTRASLMGKYKEAIKTKWPGDGWGSDERKLVLLASAILDSLALAGGLSVPATLGYMVALLVMDDSPAAPLRLEDVAGGGPVLHDFMLETLRRFAPVSGVPAWLTDDGGATWRHEIPSLLGALMDPSVFPEPLAFKPGRPGLNHADDSLSMGWADPALVDGDVASPNSHACPGRLLSMQVILAFMQELAAAGPWKVEDPKISNTMYATSGWTLRKAGV